MCMIILNDYDLQSCHVLGIASVSKGSLFEPMAYVYSVGPRGSNIHHGPHSALLVFVRQCICSKFIQMLHNGLLNTPLIVSRGMAEKVIEGVEAQWRGNAGSTSLVAIIT